MDDTQKNSPDPVPDRARNVETPPEHGLTHEDRIGIRRACRQLERIVTQIREMIEKDTREIQEKHRLHPSQRGMSPDNKWSRRKRHMISLGIVPPELIAAEAEEEMLRREARRAHFEYEEAYQRLMDERDKVILGSDPWIKRAKEAKEADDDFPRLVFLIKAVYDLRGYVAVKDRPAVERAHTLMNSLRPVWDVDIRELQRKASEPPALAPEPTFPTPPFSDLAFDSAGGKIVTRLAEGFFDPVEDYELNFAARQLASANGQTQLRFLPRQQGEKDHPVRLVRETG